MVGMQLKGKATAEDVLAEVTRRPGLVQGQFETLVLSPDLTVNVVVAHRDAHGIGRNGHAFNEDVRVVANDVAVFEGARLAFIGVTHQVLLHGKLGWHETPLQARGEARTAATPEGGGLEFCDDFLLSHSRATVGSQDLLEREVAAPGLVVLEVPALWGEVCEDLR